jgi:hypothetical protein
LEQIVQPAVAFEIQPLQISRNFANANHRWNAGTQSAMGRATEIMVSNKTQHGIHRRHWKGTNPAKFSEWGMEA